MMFTPYSITFQGKKAKNYNEARSGNQTLNQMQKRRFECHL
jgi:hypothetical protein